MELVTLILPGHHWDMVTVLPTGTNLILVTLVLTLAYSEPGVSDSTWVSRVTGDSDLSMASPDLVLWFPSGPHLDLMSLVPTGPYQDLVSRYPPG